MAILRMNDVRKMSPSEVSEKVKALRFELAKSGTTANKAKAKTKEIKRAISRLLTHQMSTRKLNKSQGLLKNK